MIPAGYQLHVTTWENDADDFKTKIISGLAKEEVEFYVEIAKKFSSRNNHDNKGLGNGSVTGDQLEEIVRSALANHPHISDELRSAVKSCFEEDALYDVRTDLYDFLVERLLGTPENEFYADNYTNFCRVYDSHKVYYYPQAVEEVTEQFP